LRQHVTLGQKCLCTFSGTGRLANQADGFSEQVAIFRINRQDSQPHTGQRLNCVFEPGWQDNQIRLKSKRAFNRKVLRRTNIGQVQKLWCALGIDWALAGLGFDANQLILKAEGDQERG